MNYDKLQTFRQRVYEHLGGTRDVLFELMDAVMLTPKPSSFVELSTIAVFRRGWNSIYAGLRDSCTHSAKLKQLCLEQVPTDSRPLLAGDHTAWSRPHARTLKERTYEHQGAAPWNQKPVTVGQGYSTLVVGTRRERKLGSAPQPRADHEFRNAVDESSVATEASVQTSESASD